MNMPAGGAATAKSSRPTVSLVLGILGIVCCQVCAPFAWWLGSKELKAIRAGQSSAEGEGMAKAGMILGIIGTILFIFALIWIVVGGGMAVISGLMQSTGH